MVTRSVWPPMPELMPVPLVPDVLLPVLPVPLPVLPVPLPVPVELPVLPVPVLLLPLVPVLLPDMLEPEPDEPLIPFSHRPVTWTLWPTCCCRFLPISMMSPELDPLVDPAPLVPVEPLEPLDALEPPLPDEDTLVSM